MCVCSVYTVCVYIYYTYPLASSHTHPPTHPPIQPPPPPPTPHTHTYAHTGSSLGSLLFVKGLGRSLHALCLGNDSLLPQNFRSICGHGVGFPPPVALIRSAGNAAAHILVADLFSTRILDNLQMQRLLSRSLLPV